MQVVPYVILVSAKLNCDATEEITPSLESHARDFPFIITDTLRPFPVFSLKVSHRDVLIAQITAISYKRNSHRSRLLRRAQLPRSLKVSWF